MNKNLILFLTIIIVSLITMIITNNFVEIIKERTTNEIIKAIKVEDVEMTEDGILVELNFKGELNYYYWEDRVVVVEGTKER